MTIKVGDTIPSSRFRVLGPDGPAWKTTDEVFKGKKVALFAVPGAFTGVCSNQHLPSIVDNVAAIKARAWIPSRSPRSTITW
jgi:peroxiredoxin